MLEEKIKQFIENEKYCLDIIKNKNGIGDYINSLTNEDVINIANKILKELENNTIEDLFKDREYYNLTDIISDYVYSYKDWYKLQIVLF